MFEHHLTDPWAAHPVVNPRNICAFGGGGIGGGLGSILGTIAGVALAPETGGLSLAIPALGGALGGFGGTALGDLVTGQPFNLGQAGLAAGTGALGGGFTGAGGFSGIADALGGASTAAGAGGASAAAAADPFGFADLSGAAGGLGGGALPTATDFTSDLGAGISTGVGGETGTGLAGSTVASGAGSGLPGDLGTATGSASATLNTFGDETAAGGASGVAGAPGGLTSDAGFAGVTAPGSVPGGGAVSGINSGGGGIMDWLKANQNWLLPAGMALNAGKQLVSPSQIPGASDLTANSGLARTIAGQNASGLNPAQSAAFSGTLQDQISQIKAKYASLGLSGSTAEQQDIQKAQNANLGQQAGAITGNVNTALNAIGSSNASTTALANQQVQEDQQLQQAIMALALASGWGLSH